MFFPECSSVDEDQNFVSHAEKDFSKSLKKKYTKSENISKLTLSPETFYFHQNILQ